MSGIPSFYRNRSIFVTGATGFVAKVLVEKILRSCPDVNKIYILIRPKRSLDVPQRMRDLTSSTVFDKLRKDQPDILGKLVPVAGDLILPDLGLSSDDRQSIKENVSIVFHSGASVNFGLRLDLNVISNVKATTHVLNIAKTIRNLESFVHLSTAYANWHLGEVEEKIYLSPIEPDDLLQQVEKYGERVQSVLSHIIKDYPNTYTFSKAVTERQLQLLGKDLPVSIARPSTVCPALYEPESGWTDSFNGLPFLFGSVGMGITRTMLLQPECRVDTIPVDILANMLIAISWYRATHERSDDIPVYHCASYGVNIAKLAVVEDILQTYTKKNPFKDAVWYPDVKTTSNRFVNNYRTLFYHRMPIKIMEAFFSLSGNPKVRKLEKAKFFQTIPSVYEFSMLRNCNFLYGRIGKLQEAMSAIDKKIFPISLSGIDYTEYFQLIYRATKKYLYKEEPYASPEAIKHLQRLYWKHRILQGMLLLVMGTPTAIGTLYYFGM